MKDGTELTHYGVKGMKWGKKLFGKVKGVFGKPNQPKPSTSQPLDHLARLATDTDRSLTKTKGLNAFSAPGNDRKYQATRDMLQARYAARYEVDPSRKQKEANIAANTVKKRSKRINGR